MKKILVVNVNWIGDVIFSSPVFKALKAAYPAAKISCLAVPRVREILECVPDVDEIIVYDEDGIHKSFWAKIKLIYALSQRHFDAAFLLHRSLTRALFVFWAGIPRRIGYDTKNRGPFLTHKIKAPDEREVHRADYYFNILESFGVPVSERESLLTVPAESEKEISVVLKNHDIAQEDYLVVIHPGGNWDLKRWPVPNFTLLIEQLMNDGNVKVAVSGAGQDIPLAETIVSGLRRKPVMLAGTINLKQLIALMKRANCVVSADSGPLHIAGSVGSNTVGIFGPTRPEITGPRGRGRSIILQYDVGCNRRACYHLACPDNTCMQAVSVAKVMDAIRQVQNQ